MRKSRPPRSHSRHSYPLDKPIPLHQFKYRGQQHWRLTSSQRQVGKRMQARKQRQWNRRATQQEQEYEERL